VLGKFPAQVSKRDSYGKFYFESGTAEAAIPLHEGSPSYGIMICQACKNYFVAEQDVYENWVAVYPLQHKPVPEEIPEPIKSELNEASLCFAIGVHIGCLLLCRTALIALQRQQGVSSIKELKDKGIISERMYLQADEVRLWANIVGHDNIDPNVIKRDDIEQLLIYLESIIDAVYIQPARLAALTQKREDIKKSSKAK
jgi:hypothetical protein